MLLRSFDEMLTAYGIDELEKSDQADRSGMLMLCPYAVLFKDHMMNITVFKTGITKTYGYIQFLFCFMASWIMTMAFSSSFLMMLLLHSGSPN